MQIDVGFADAIIPEPKTVNYPVLLEDGNFKIKGYSIESIIAEKFQAMVKLDIINSRMKDFFDIWMISKTFDIDGASLFKAVKTTFGRRNTRLTNPVPLALTSEFASNKQVQWKAFLRKQELAKTPPADFDVIISQLRDLLLPICDSWNSNSYSGTWKAGKGWVLPDKIE